MQDERRLGFFRRHETTSGHGPDLDRRGSFSCRRATLEEPARLRESCVTHFCLARPAPASCEIGMITLHPWRRPMERMQHVRGKILNGEETVIDQVDGYLAEHDHKGRKTLFGYFEKPTEELK